MVIEKIKMILATDKLTKESLKTATHIFLFGMWVLLQNYLGNKFYAFFIIVFFLLLAIPRQPTFVLVAISVLVIVLFNTPTIDTLTEVKRSNLNMVSNIQPSLEKVLSPNTGEQVLPVQVQQMLSLLRTHHITNYQITGELTTDPLIMQRIVESAWPIKFETTAPYHLISLAEINHYPTCDFIDKGEAVALVYCHK